MKKVLFVGGKGGVGKSSISSALALSLANEGKKVLLISTDPAHNLCDIFDSKISTNIVKISDFLDILEIDARYETKNFIENVANKTKKFVSTQNYEKVQNYYESVAKSKTSEESAMFERLVKIITDSKNYEHFIIDTAPTGHTLRLLNMPKELMAWSKTLLNYTNKGAFYDSIIGTQKGANPYRAELLEILDERYQRYSAFFNILKNQSDYFWVLNPDKLSLNETKNTINSLENYMQKSSKIIVNKILPDNSSDEFFASRIKLQNEFLTQIKSEFKDYTIAFLPLLKEDITSLEALNILAKSLNFSK